MPKISLIAAVDENNAIGNEGRLLCDLPDDRLYFKQQTWGYPIIMGRKTYESLPNGALPGRRNIVLSTDLEFSASDCEIARSVEAALSFFENRDRVYIIGGESLYRATISLADELLITRIHHSFEDADVFFSQIDLKQWQKVSEIFHPADAEHLYSFSFMKFEKK